MKAVLKIVFLLLVIMLETWYAVAQDPMVDSLKMELSKAKHDTIQISILSQLSNIAPDGEWQKYNNEGKRLAQKKLKNATGKTREFYLLYLSTVYNNEGLDYKNRGEIDKAIASYKKSLKIANEFTNHDNSITTLVNLGRVFYEKSDVLQALNYFSEAFHEYEKKPTASLAITIAYTFNFVGEIYKGQQQHQKSYEYYHKALKEFKKLNDKQGVAITYSYFGATLWDQKKQHEALSYFRKSNAILWTLEDYPSLASNYNNIGTIYQNTGKVDSSFLYYYKSIALFNSLQNKNGLNISYKNLGTSHYLKGQMDSALYYFNYSLKLAYELGFPRNIEFAAKGLYNVYKEKGDAKRALEMHELYVKMKDSTEVSNHQKATIANQYKYEYERKQYADSVKAASEKKVIEAKLVQTQTQLFLYVSIAVLVITIAFIVIQRLRFRQKMNELKLRNKIAADLHDDVGSALSSISVYSGLVRMQNDADVKNELVGKIEKTSRETLSNMSDIVWSLLPRNDNMQELLLRMEKFKDELFQYGTIKFQFNIEQEVKKINMTMHQRQHLYLIYKEAINNISKYSGATEAIARLSMKNKNLVMEIKDNGCGFDTQAKRAGNGLYTMKNRADEMGGYLEISSEIEKGTLIRLVFKPN